jgi:hypothetical protein
MYETEGAVRMVACLVCHETRWHSPTHMISMPLGNKSYVHCAKHRVASCSRVTQYLAQRSSTPSEEEGASLALTQQRTVHAQ